MLRGLCFCLFLFFAWGGALRADPAQLGLVLEREAAIRPVSVGPAPDPARVVFSTRYGRSALSGLLSVDAQAPSGTAGIGLQYHMEEGVTLRGQVMQELPQSGTGVDRRMPGVRVDLMSRF